MELGHHERNWSELGVKVNLLLVSLHVADHVELVLSEVLDSALLLLRDFIYFS